MYFFDRRFVSSNGWLRNFAKLFKFSCQRPRLAHRPVISLTHLYYEYTFLNEVQTLSPQYDTSLIINMDETMIRQVSSPRRVWGKKNHPWRNVNTNSCPKNGNELSLTHSLSLSLSLSLKLTFSRSLLLSLTLSLFIDHFL